MGVAAVADSREPKLKADVLAAEWLDKNVTILDEHTGGAPLSVQDYFILLEWQNPDAPFTREERVQILRPIATRYLAQEAAKVAAAEALRKRGNHEFRHGEPDCIHCGCFGPLDEYEPCTEEREKQASLHVSPDEHNSSARLACLEEIVLGKEYCTLERGHQGAHVFRGGAPSD